MVVNVLILYQVTFYVLSLVLSICIFLPITFHLYDFKGYCLLFTNGTWRDDGQFTADWASQSICDISIIWGGIIFIISITQIHRFIKYLYTDTDASFLGAFADVVVSVTMTLGTLAEAISLTMGFQIWCDAIMRRFEQCADASQNDIMKEEKINTAMFYIQFGTAQFGIWCLWVCFVGLSVVAVLKMCRLHQLENIRSSMSHERSRLVINRESPNLT